MKFYSLNVQTLDVESTAICLGVGLIYCDTDEHKSFTDIIKDGINVKFLANEQKKDYNRTYSKNTIEFWQNQNEEIKKGIYYPGKYDFDLLYGLQKIISYIDNNEKNIPVFTNGYFSQMIIVSLFKSANLFCSLFNINNFRDYKTCFDLIKNTSDGKGNCKIDMTRNDFISHIPINEAAYSAYMMINGE